MIDDLIYNFIKNVIICRLEMNMLQKTSSKLTDMLIKLDAISKGKASMYRYGFELLISCVIGILILFIFIVYIEIHLYGLLI